MPSREASLFRVQRFILAYTRGGNLIGAVKPAGSRHAAARVGLWRGPLAAARRGA